MGVTRMFSYIRRNSDHCVEFVDFVEVAAARKGGIKLLVDFYSWEHFIKSKFMSCLELKTDNPYLILCGGEYRLISDYMTSFVEALRSVNIEMIFFMDGAKGSSDLGTDRKWGTWMERQTRDVMMTKKVIQILNGELPIESLDIRDVARPCLQEVQNILTLQKLGCKIHAVVSGEADTFIARCMLEDKSTVAVFTNDTDFCIFPGSVYLCENYFDTKNDLEMENASLKVTKPQKLICGLVKSDTLWQHLEFPSISSLCELAILAGNDFTLPILHQISSWESYIGNIYKLRRIINQYKVVEKWPMFVKILVSHPELQRAVQHSRKFYSLTLPEEKYEQTQDATASIISNAIEGARFPSSVFSMYKRFYWHRMILEDTGQSCNTAERAMVYLRSYVYSLILPRHQDYICEYGRTHYNDFEEMTAYKIKQIRLPSLVTVQKNSFQKNRALFHLIMSHQEFPVPDFNKSFFRLYGNKLGFICYLLRYFLLLNWHQNMCITPGEFLLICVWLLGNNDPENYIHTKIVPHPRCITIANWVLCLFRTSFAFVSSLLNLTQEFPAPADLFSGAIWVSLYTASNLSPESQSNTSAHQQLSQQYIMSVNEGVKDVLKERKHVIDNIVRGLFPVNPLMNLK